MNSTRRPTIDDLQEQGVFEGPGIVSPRSMLPARPPVPTIDPFLALLDQLDAAKWCVKLTTVVEHGQRRHIARVWRMDGLGGSKKASGVSRVEALTRAYEDAKRLRHQRAQQGRGEVAAPAATQETHD